MKTKRLRQFDGAVRLGGQRVLVAGDREVSLALICFGLRDWKGFKENVSRPLLLEISSVQTAVRPQVDEAVRALEEQRVALLAQNGIDRFRSRKERGERCEPAVIRADVVHVCEGTNEIPQADFCLSPQKNELLIF